MPDEKIEKDPAYAGTGHAKDPLNTKPSTGHEGTGSDLDPQKGKSKEEATEPEATEPEATQPEKTEPEENEPEENEPENSNE